MLSRAFGDWFYLATGTMVLSGVIFYAVLFMKYRVKYSLVRACAALFILGQVFLSYFYPGALTAFLKGLGLGHAAGTVSKALSAAATIAALVLFFYPELKRFLARAIHR